MTIASAPHRLLILAPNWLGDAVMALPLLADLRRAWPETSQSVAARRVVASLFEMVPGVVQTLTLEGRGGVHSLTAAKRDALALAAENFDAALLLPNSFYAAWLVSRAKIPERWGFARDVRGRLLTRAFPRPSAEMHQAAYYQELGARLGVPVGERLAAVHVPAGAIQGAAAHLSAAGIVNGRAYVVFAPGAAYGRAKQWLPERFAELAAILGREAALPVVLVGAGRDDSACDEIVRLVRKRPSVASPGSLEPINLCGQTDLAALAAIFAASAAVVANDSGAMHLASAVGARVVAIFGPTDDRKTSPLRAHANAPLPAIVSTPVWCRPCMLRECPIDHRCMTGVSAREVFETLSAAGG